MEARPVESKLSALKGLILPIRTSEDIVLVRAAVRKLAVEIKLSLVDQTKIVTAASEIARNTVEHGKGGDVGIERTSSVRTGIRLTFVDSGPGITDIGQALKDGFTSGSGMGLGLGGARRLVDEFTIASKPNGGTTVTLTKWIR